MYRAHRVVIFAVAQLSCKYCYHCRVLTSRENVHCVRKRLQFSLHNFNNLVRLSKFWSRNIPVTHFAKNMKFIPNIITMAHAVSGINVTQISVYRPHVQAIHVGTRPMRRSAGSWRRLCKLWL